MKSRYLLKFSYPSKYKMKRGRHVRLFSDPPPRTLPTLMTQVEHYYYFSSLCMRMRENWYLEKVCGGPYIVWRGRFLVEISAEMLITDVGMAVETFLPRLRGPGTRPGSAESGVRPAPPGRLSLLPLDEWLLGGPSWVLRRCRGFVHWFSLTCGPFFVSVTQD